MPFDYSTSAAPISSGRARIATGLPGKQIKLPINGSGSPGRPNPLGISIDTNVGPSRVCAPQEIYAGRSGEQSTQIQRPATSQEDGLARSSLKPAHHVSTDLSPYDRDIQIGMSVDAPPAVPPIARRPSNAQPTPSILITPVDDEWSPVRRMVHLRSHLRSASSIYTRMNSISRKHSLITRIPPLPSFDSATDSQSPPDPRLAHSRKASAAESLQTVFESDDLSRIHSDDEPLTARTAEDSDSYEVALATPLRALGWWNVITSPFAGRLGTISDRRILGLSTIGLGRTFSSSTSDARATSMSMPTEKASPADSERMARAPVGEAAKNYDLANNFGSPTSNTKSPGQSQRLAATEVVQDENVNKGLLIDTQVGSKRETRPNTVYTETPTAAGHLDDAFSPVVEMASVGIFQSASSVIARTPKLPQAAQPDKPPDNFQGSLLSQLQSPQHLQVSQPLGKPTSQPQTQSQMLQRSWPQIEPHAPPPPPKEPGPSKYQPAVRSLEVSDSQMRETNHTPTEDSRQPTPIIWQNEKQLDKIEKGNAKKHPRRCCTKQRLLALSLSTMLASVVLVSVVLAMTLTRIGGNMPVQESFLNLTGYPPIPTGVMTVSQPYLVGIESGCTSSPDMWSCSVSNDQQASSISSSSGDPNFRLEIVFSNSTSFNTSLTQRISRKLVRKRSTTSFPMPPSEADQLFLGNMTDNITSPYNGEATPFFISFLPTSLSSNTTVLTKRQQLSNASGTINRPITAADGNPLPALLYPLPEHQPLKLYDRGQSTEHYGFYTYFDRSIFLQAGFASDGSTLLTNMSSVNQNGGASAAQANVQCFWSQSRFLVQIWTNLGISVPASKTSVSNTAVAAGNSSASMFTFPGSFPLPITVTLDRHGGDPVTKAVYCFKLENGRLIKGEQYVQDENRAFGGTLVNPAPGPFSSPVHSGVYGGVDGGLGGCQCRWGNWQ